MQLESERANAFYKSAAALVHATDRAALFPARLMSSVYQLLLSKLERKNFPVFGAPLRLGLADRLWALAVTLLR
jgi:phytoene/squalene synthetase